MSTVIPTSDLDALSLACTTKTLGPRRDLEAISTPSLQAHSASPRGQRRFVAGLATKRANPEPDVVNSRDDDNNNIPAALLSLSSRDNGKCFATRTIRLLPRTEVAVGRANATVSHSCTSNGIFDCRVLSRKHASVWYEDGRFFIKDLFSSNGTFVNSVRVPGGQAVQLYTRDTVQFGQVTNDNQTTFESM